MILKHSSMPCMGPNTSECNISFINKNKPKQTWSSWGCSTNSAVIDSLSDGLS